MEKLLVTIFESEQQARDGTRVLQQLHDEGILTVYAAARVVKAADGSVSYESLTGEGPRPLLLGGLIGALVGLLGGPLGLPVGIAGGAFVATMYDFVRAGGREEFLNRVAEHLLREKAAVVALVEETQVLPVDTALQAVGGLVFRQPAAENAYLLLEQELESLGAEIDALEAEHAGTTGEARAQLQVKLAALEARRLALMEEARALLEDAQQVAEFKAASLEAQAARAAEPRRALLLGRAARVRADYERSRARLQQACDEARQPLAA
ncbi:MAG: DUF1269 domain-containing protein [Armatimonadota bacterium]